MNTNIFFSTATIYKWKKLLLKDSNKDIIIGSMQFLVSNKRAKIHAFVIMPNHIHTVWKILQPHALQDVQRDFLKYTSQQLKFSLKKNNPEFLNEFLVNATDRQYQIWQRNSLSVALYSSPVFEQKINYIHANPSNKKWNLVENIIDYRYSSAGFYYKGTDEWGFLSHFEEEN